MKVIIIGAVAAGLSAAAKIRRLDKDIEITVYEKGTDISYGACGMPYLLSGIIQSEQDLVMKSIEDFHSQNISIKTNHEVITVIPETNEVSVFCHDKNSIVKDNYDKLIIATGAKAKRTFVSGSNSKNIYTLKNLEDSRRISEKLKTSNKIVIVGGGYIGIEIAENLVKIGKEVIIIENNDQILDIMDYDVAKKAELELESIGVNIFLRERLESYSDIEPYTLVKTNEREIKCDMVIEAIGISPNTVFLKELGLEMLNNGAIVVNKKLETSIPNIYAIGDCAAYYSDLFNKHLYLPLATNAVKAGKIVAHNVIQGHKELSNIIGSTILKVGNLSIAKTGYGFEEAQRAGLDYGYIDIKAKTKPSYYPGGKDLFIRIIYDKQTSILKGAQLFSEEDVNGRINIMALAISTNMTAEEFSFLDFAYTPPYSSVNEPLQIATRKIIK